MPPQSPKTQTTPKLKTHLLPQPHNLEPLEIRQLPPPRAPRPAQRPRALLPRLVHLRRRPLLADRAGARALGDLGHDHVREGYVREGGGVAGDERGGGGGGAVYEDLWWGVGVVSGLGVWVGGCVE